MNTNNKHLILGFTGGIGRAVALALSNREIPIRAVVRNQEKAKKYASGIKNLELMEGDGGNEADLDKAFADVSTVHYCINIPYPQWEQKAIRLFSVCLEAATKHKVRLIFPGNVYVYGHAKYNPVDEKHPHAAHTKKGQIRMEMEEMLALAHQDKGLEYSIIRMPDFYGPFVVNSFSEQLYVNALKGKAMQWIGNLETEIELIFIEDGGEAMVQASLNDESKGEVYNIPGVAITTAREYLQEINKQAAKNAKISTLNSNIIFKVAGLFNSVIKEVLEMLYLKREKLILDGSKFKREFDEIPSTPYKEGIKKTLDWSRQFFDI